MSDNPYATPQVVDVPVQPLSDVEAVRKEHLGTEASIKSIGLLYGLGAFFLVVVAFTPFDEKTEFEQLYSALFGGLAVLYAFMGFAIRRFKAWARWIAVVLSVPGLIGFPIGTVISIYFLYLLLGRKGAMVFSAPYQEVIAATPHIKYKTSKWVWIALGLLLLVFGFIMVMAFVSAR
jgi:hypothetical protein